MFRDLGAMDDLSHGLVAIADLAAVQGQAARAARLFGAAGALRDGAGFQSSPQLQSNLGRCIAEIRSQMGEDAFAAAWAEGRAMSMDQAIALAMMDN